MNDDHLDLSQRLVRVLGKGKRNESFLSVNPRRGRWTSTFLPGIRLESFRLRRKVVLYSSAFAGIGWTPVMSSAWSKEHGGFCLPVAG